ncbi:chemotaxis protein CheR [Bordetella genomosp. 5]|uniref:CheR family methyltransferase n=1 Tax=Bordetella genomosp. 5 TaxID=1395608 RepID=UPI000B9EAADC|nr:protein-glutamate O-methyltransferase CheR [Bordetella genomosp. 5]OZI39941.1 chemotaxis protein CheR [Bordetella genomosp. 5]
MNLLPEFSAMLKREIGLDTGSVGQAAIERAVRLRLSACGIHDERAYLQHVQISAAERQQLIEAVVVPETWFFRYPESLVTLAELARKRLQNSAGVGLLRVLSIPCSTGEEPYSIAMALLDVGVPADQVVIDAIDISERALETARNGRYGRNSFRGEDLSFRDRHFAGEADGTYVLAPAPRRGVRFVQGNLFDAGLLQDQLPYDFVFCRNLLIYFDTATQDRAIQVLARLTRPEGVMFFGPAEASLLTARGYAAVASPRVFAFYPRTRADGAHDSHGGRPGSGMPPLKPAAAAPTSFARRVGAGAVASPAAASTSALAATALAAAARAAVPRAAPRFAAPPAAPAATTAGAAADAALDEVTALADQGRLEDALAACNHYVATHGGSARAFHLSGLLHDAAGRPRDAESAYRKALYLAPRHREALLHLAALVAARGDAEGAQRLQERAQRAGDGHE